MTVSGRWKTDDMEGTTFKPGPRPRKPRHHCLDLAWLRYDLGLSRQQMAAFFGISDRKLARIEADKGTVDEIVAVHVALNAYALMHRQAQLGASGG